MVIPFVLQTLRPAFLCWSLFWIVVFTIDNSSAEFTAMQMFFSMLMGMMVGHAVNEIRHSPMSWNMPGHQRFFVFFFIVHSVIWTGISGLVANERMMETYGDVPIWALIYFWFVAGASFRQSPSLLAPRTYGIWLLYIFFAMWPETTLSVMVQYPLITSLIWVVLVVGLLLSFFSRRYHRTLLSSPFMSFFSSMDESRVKIYREELISKWSSNAAVWKRNLHGAGFLAWVGAIFYENLGFMRLRDIFINFAAVIGLLVFVGSAMMMPEVTPEAYSFFALFWLSMILAVEYPVNLSRNLTYPLSRQWRGFISLMLRFSQILLCSLLFLATSAAVRLIPAFQIQIENNLTLRLYPMENPFAGVILNIAMMSGYYILVLFTKRCMHAFIIMMAISGFVFGFLAGSSQAGLLIYFYECHFLHISAITMLLLWGFLHMRHYQKRDLVF
jgi:hypothetical protein